MIFHWLKPWIFANPRPTTRRRKTRSVHRLPAEAQMLERRLLLTNYVVTTLDDVPNDPGSVSPDGQVSLREAIFAANLNLEVGDAAAGELGGAGGVTDTITFDSSLMGQTILIPGGTLFISDDLDISGFASASDLTINAQGNSRLFYISPLVTASLNHLTLTGGAIGEGAAGGGIYVEGAGLALFDVVLTGNSAASGGGLFNDNGFVFIQSSTISNNSAQVGGGIASDGADSSSGTGITITNSIITQNTATDMGGGIHNVDFGVLTITETTISQNSAGEGGGIYSDGTGNASVSISSSNITGNSASDGAGIFNTNAGLLNITSTDITGNTFDDDGGGIFNLDGIATVEDSTISGNSAGIVQLDGGSTGGGIANRGSFSITNTTISNNFANEGAGIGSFNGNLSVTGGSITGNSTDGNGGGVAVLDGNFSLFGTSVTGNTSDFSGGGVFTQSDTSTTITNSTIAMNSANRGGGIANGLNGTLSISHSTVSQNSAVLDGGGIFNRGALSLANTTISQNSAGNNGGGIFNGPGFQGGESSSVSTVIAVNSTIVLNQANAANVTSTIGGGIFTALNALTFTQLLNTIVAGNLQSISGSEDNSDLGGKNLEDNSSFNLIGDPDSAGGLMDGSSGNRVGDGLGNLLPVDQIIDPSLADNGGPTLTHLPVFNGRAIDAGSNDNAIAPGPDALLGTSDDIVLVNDQRGQGFPRVFDAPTAPDIDGGIDIGAVELDEFPTQFFEIVVLNADQPEGNMGTTIFTFAVNRTGDTSGTAWVDFTVFGADANALDFVGGELPFGMIGFDNGETQQILMIEVQGDLIVERDEVFSVQLSNPTDGGAINTSTAMGTIRNDDTAVITISDVMLAEGNSGTTVFTFTVTLSQQVDADVTFNAQTVLGGSADPMSDYTPLLTTPITFAANSMPGATQTITVDVSGDMTVEPDETFLVQLDNLDAGGLNVQFDGGDASLAATGTILNDDVLATISIFDATADELQGQISFLVFLSQPVMETVSVRIETVGLSAIEGVDFGSLDGMVLTFAPGETFQAINVPIIDDTLFEPTETLQIVLSNPLIGGVSDPTRFAILDGTADGNIVNNDTIRIIGASSGQGLASMPPLVVVQNAVTGQELYRFMAYDSAFRGGVRVASGDINGDGAADIITAAGVGGGPHVKVFDGLTGQLIREFFAYGAGFTGGVFVAVGDINGDGRQDIVTGAGAGGGPHVRVFDVQTLDVLQDFFAFNPNFSGGVSVAVGQIDGFQRNDLILGAGPGGGPHVRVVDGPSLSEIASFFAYDPGFQGGVFVASGEIADLGPFLPPPPPPPSSSVANGDFDPSPAILLPPRFDEVITVAGAGGGPHVRIFGGSNLSQMIGEFFAFDATLTNGISVGITDGNGDGTADILVGTGPGVPARIRVFSASGTLQSETSIFNAHFTSGVFVAGTVATRVRTGFIPLSNPILDVGESEALLLDSPSQPPVEDALLAGLDEVTLSELLLEALA